jgi:hypothetical protein
MNVLASLVIVGLGVAMTYLGIDIRSTWLVTASLALVLIGVWVTYRCLVMRIAFDADTLHIVGFVRSRRIPRTAVLSVERWEIEMPMIQWSMPGAADRWSILTPLILNSSPFLPASMYHRRHRFLAHLRRWAPDADTTDVRPGVWSQIGDGLARTFMAIARSRALRIAFATVGVAVAVGAYWWGVATITSVLQGSYEPTSRGWLAPIALCALAAEGAYWLLPLQTRHPRAWHIALGVLLTPLAALTLIATFS